MREGVGACAVLGLRLISIPFCLPGTAGQVEMVGTETKVAGPCEAS